LPEVSGAAAGLRDSLVMESVRALRSLRARTNQGGVDDRSCFETRISAQLLARLTAGAPVLPDAAVVMSGRNGHIPDRKPAF